MTREDTTDRRMRKRRGAKRAKDRGRRRRDTNTPTLRRRSGKTNTAGDLHYCLSIQKEKTQICRRHAPWGTCGTSPARACAETSCGACRHTHKSKDACRQALGEAKKRQTARSTKNQRKKRRGFHKGEARPGEEREERKKSKRKTTGERDGERAEKRLLLT